ncbi:hypothetical protein [Nocardiopsis composta]|uniref:Uncharacterized protein n=1 Tax=Nocardiopsis composta TaxID=157465 RepID=A0A7W8QJ50_9ACTN|nr:hypothetical protein [Nocardiopsis composta]MBB5431356.1 hypothetical protein [Nocardiopsis composta]
MSWRFYAMRWDGTWLHRDLPLADVRLSPALSGPYRITATIDPSWAELIGGDGLPLLQEWSTIILCEASGQLRGGGILTDTDTVGEKLQLTAVGVSGYPAGQPLVETLTWGGKTAGASGAGVDPLDVVRALWGHLQAQPDGDLGVTFSSTSTPYRLGAWHNARRVDADGKLDPDAKAVQDPPIPIDKVWDPKTDKKPAAAKGKSVYWKYELAWHAGVEIGQKIDELARQASFEWREHYAWADTDRESVVMRLEFGYPRIGRRQTNLRFVQDENITQLVPVKRDGTSFANEVRTFGAGEGAKQVKSVARVRDGRLRRARSEDRPDVSSAASLKSIAQDELLRTNSLDDITGFTIRDHPNAPIGSFDIGDDVLVEGRAWGRWVRLWVRITGFSFSPTSGDVQITCSRSDRFRYGGAA